MRRAIYLLSGFAVVFGLLWQFAPDAARQLDLVAAFVLILAGILTSTRKIHGMWFAIASLIVLWSTVLPFAFVSLLSLLSRRQPPPNTMMFLPPPHPYLQLGFTLLWVALLTPASLLTLQDLLQWSRQEPAR